MIPAFVLIAAGAALLLGPFVALVIIEACR